MPPPACGGATGFHQFRVSFVPIISQCAYIEIGESVDASDGDRVFERAAELFALLSTRVRLRIVRELLDGEKNVSQLMACVGASQPNLSDHLAVLYRSGLLSRRRDGAHVLYRIADDRLGLLAQWMAAQGLGVGALSPPLSTSAMRPGGGQAV
jgi:ArsR family transcriptional regulator